MWHVITKQQVFVEMFYKQLDEDFDRNAFFAMFPSARSFPQIKVDGNSIGGYTDLESWYQNRT